MWTSLFGGLGDHLTARTSLARLVPAVVFWLGGLVALWLHASSTWWGWGPASLIARAAHGLAAFPVLRSVPNPFSGLPPIHAPHLSDVLSLEGALVLIAVSAASALVVEPLVLMTLQLAEGHRWPRWLQSVLAGRLGKKQAQAQADLARFEELLARADRLTGTPEAAELRRLIRARIVLASTMRTMPTVLGDRIAAGEDRPELKYGLNVIVWWPRLWLVMPEGTREELAGARTALDEGARVLLWSALFTFWAFWAWPALPVAILSAVVAYRWMIRAGTTYATLLEAAFDMHRTSLYRALRWPLPSTPEDEFETAKRVTWYLDLGPRNAHLLQEPVFVNGSEEDGNSR